jgi:hypothetical protein
MGFLKRIGKSIKKVVKGIGKGIKKVAKKVFGAIGKLGPIGQLGLMFLGVPPVLGNFFSGVANFAGNFIPEAIKGAWAGIKAAGSGAWSSITEGISNGVDRVMNFTKGKGFTLSEGRTSIFTQAPKPKVDDVTKAITDATVETGDISLEYKTPTTEERLKRSILESDATKTSVDVSTKGFFESFKERITDPTELAKRGSAALLDIGQQRATVAGMEDMPTQMHLDMTPFMMKTTEQRLLDSTTWQGISNQYQQAGAFGGAASGDAATPYFAAMGGLDDNTFNVLVPTPTSPRPATPGFFN